VVVVDVAAAEYPLLAHPDPLDLMVKMDKMELLVKTETMAQMVKPQHLQLNMNHASNVLMLPLDPLVTQDLKDLPVMLVHLVPLLMVVHVDPLAQLDLLDLPDLLVQMENLVHLVLPVLSTMFPAQKDPLDPLAQMDNPDLLDLLAPMDNLDNLEAKDPLEMLDPMVPQETQEQMEMLVPTENLELEVLAITALLHVPHLDIKPFNNHLWEADLLLKAWLPYGRVDKISFSLLYFSPFFLIFLDIVFFGETKKIDSTWVVTLVASPLPFFI
jgi:hypothetical protein